MSQSISMRNSKVLIIDLRSTSVEDDFLKVIQEALDLELTDISELGDVHAIWPNLLKRYSLVVVLGASGLVDEEPELASLLETLMMNGVAALVASAENPLVNASRALVNGIHYVFGVHQESYSELQQVIAELLTEPSQVFTA